MTKKYQNPKVKILLLDIETAPLEVYCWGIHGPQFISLNQIIKDWSILSYAAKYLGESKIYYNDNRNEKDPRNDKKIVKELRDLIEASDILVYQNGDRFDLKKTKARMIFHSKLDKSLKKPLSKKKTFDTYKVGKKEFGFTSHKLEYMCEHLGLENRKLKSKKFLGMDLWRGCLNKVKAAWDEMAAYNKMDVLTLEDLYMVMRPHGTGLDYDIYTGDRGSCPTCGSLNLKKEGIHKNKTGHFQQFSCKVCYSWSTGKENLISLDERKLIKKKI